MQNNSTGVLATKVPWTSCRAHPGDRPGRSTPAHRTRRQRQHVENQRLDRHDAAASRNNSPNVITAIRPSTAGSRDVMASTLSRLVCAMPVRSIGRSAGPGTACSRSSGLRGAGTVGPCYRR